MTLKAIAVKDGVSSSVAKADFVIDPSIAETVEAPTITPAGGIFSIGENVVVTLACATSGAEIYYTANGSTPTASSARYNVAMTVASNMTIKAVAIKNGKSSAVTSAQFIFTNGVDDINTDYNVVRADYYTLSGVKLLTPTAGQPYIKVATLSDGSLRVTKVVTR